ncbi:MAG: ATP:cob(I)alamin adenosyltransferase [Rickettsiales bacterium]|nr:ATP:cob(I)alamin adenosyltransferase [Rickettsiales bacterium]|tara:strand:+ start:2486 stop:3067 length:582 start_codon:yes stop_codon:yes gene_type:complete
MRITKVYTRTGDSGNTHLVGGSKVRKDDIRVEAYGSVDELNSWLGAARAELSRSSAANEKKSNLDAQLAVIQSELFDLGTVLATPPADRFDGMTSIQKEDVLRLEQEIDLMNDGLPPLKEFILPGGGPCSSQLHLARAVCRRAERRALPLTNEDPSAALSLTYLNRLSDWLFVAARWHALACGEQESFWQQRR